MKSDRKQEKKKNKHRGEAERLRKTEKGGSEAKKRINSVVYKWRQRYAERKRERKRGRKGERERQCRHKERIRDRERGEESEIGRQRYT